MTRPVDVLLEFLEAEQTRGVTHVHLDEGARDGLRQLFERSRPGAKTSASAVESPEPAAVATPPPAAPVKLEIIGSSKAEKLAALKIQAENHPTFKALGTLRETLVFAIGDPHARIMLIGDAPGYHEEREGEPFAGPAGQKLSKILETMGLSREQVFLTTLVKHRPATARQTTNNRPPTPEEVASGLPFLRAEISIVQPHCIIALGESTAAGLLGKTEPMTFLRRDWHEFDGIPVRVTYHPSYLLQTGGSSNQTKRYLWEDMLAVMEKTAMPISEKQRGFFLLKP